MKYCSHCGAEIEDDAVICVNCGCATNDGKSKVKEGNSSMGKIALVFMIIGCVFSPLSGLYSYLTNTDNALDFFALGELIGGLLCLAWCIPMTIYFARKLKKGESVGTAFKVCTLLFVNIIAGILMFCMPKEDK